MNFSDMTQAAEMLSQSDIVPVNYRRQRMVKGVMKENPSAAANVLAVMFAGQDYGWNPMTAMRLMHVIEGQAALKPEAILGLARRAGHAITFEFADHEVTVHGIRSDNGDTASASFSMKDAARAGLTHKDVWKKYPQDMMMWRAVSKLGRRLFSDLMLGASYTPEELDGPEPTPEELGTSRAHAIEAVVDAEILEAPVAELENPATGEPVVVEVPDEERPPPGNLAPSLSIIKGDLEEDDPPIEEVGGVLDVPTAKQRLVERVATTLEVGIESEAAIDRAREIWQEEIGIGVAHVDPAEMQRMLTAANEPF